MHLGFTTVDHAALGQQFRTRSVALALGCERHDQHHSAEEKEDHPDDDEPRVRPSGHSDDCQHYAQDQCRDPGSATSCEDSGHMNLPVFCSEGRVIRVINDVDKTFGLEVGKKEDSRQTSHCSAMRNVLRTASTQVKGRRTQRSACRNFRIARRAQTSRNCTTSSTGGPSGAGAGPPAAFLSVVRSLTRSITDRCSKSKRTSPRRRRLRSRLARPADRPKIALLEATFRRSPYASELLGQGLLRHPFGRLGRHGGVVLAEVRRPRNCDEELWLTNKPYLSL